MNDMQSVIGRLEAEWDQLGNDRRAAHHLRATRAIADRAPSLLDLERHVRQAKPVLAAQPTDQDGDDSNPCQHLERVQTVPHGVPWSA
jgi:hypothetical protein